MPRVCRVWTALSVPRGNVGLAPGTHRGRGSMVAVWD